MRRSRGEKCLASFAKKDAVATERPIHTHLLPEAE